MPPTRAASIIVLMAVLPALAAIGYGMYTVAGCTGLCVAGIGTGVGLAQVFGEAVFTGLANLVLSKRKPPS